MELSEIFNQFPEFKKWVDNKKLRPKELTILTEFQSSLSLSPLIQWIESHKPTHSQGIQILELGGELLLMSRPFDSLLVKETQAQLLIEQLKKLRLSETYSRDEKKSQIVKGLLWPSSIQARWLRQGDRGALSVQFKSFSMKDFKQKIHKLGDVYNQLNQGMEKLWKE